MTHPTYSPDPAIDEILLRAVDGEALTGGEILTLMDEGEVHALGRAAHDLRLRQCDPQRVTFVVDRNINYSNVCYADCTFCAFYRHKDADGAYVLSYEQIYEKIEELLEIGGTQVLLQGGHHPNLKLDWYQGLLRGIKERYPVHIHGFSPSEVLNFSKVFKMSTREVIAELQAAGLDSIPGGGAEILVDRVRTSLARSKVDAAGWLGIMEEAHSLGMRTTATMMFGHIETIPERVEHLLRVRESQARTGGYTAFIPWTFQPGFTPMAESHPDQLAQVPTSTHKGSIEYLRVLAICRLALNNIANFQSSWVTQGQKIGQLSLFWGANDLGSVMMEENVVSQAGVSFRLSLAQMTALVQDAGFEAAQRDNFYNILRAA